MTSLRVALRVALIVVPALVAIGAPAHAASGPANRRAAMRNPWPPSAVRAVPESGADLASQALDMSRTPIIRNSFGLQREGDALVGGGPDYAVVFDERGIRYTPALGRSVERDQPLRLTLDSIRRGDTVLYRAGTPERPTLEANSAIYARGDHVVERYDVRRDGVEQSFVFDRLPAGAGDLVVRLRVETELVRVPGVHSNGSLRFECAAGGVTVGSVVGIDASGRRAAGNSATDSASLELSLPADFVAGARYPLTLDPLIGTAFSLTPGEIIDTHPTAAYDAANSVYLVAWTRYLSATNGDVRAQRVSTVGTLVGGLIAVETGAANAMGTSVGSCRSSERFLVAWQADGDIWARGVTAASGAASPGTLQVTSSPGLEHYVRVAGEGTLADNDLLLVWRAETSGKSLAGIHGREVELPPNGDPINRTSFTVVTGANDRLPCISHSAGADERCLVAWVRDGSDGSRRLYCRLFDRNGQAQSTVLLLTSYDIGTYLDDYTRVAVDGDGSSFLAAWGEVGASAGAPLGPNIDVKCRRVSVGGLSGLILGSIEKVTTSSDRQEVRPEVAFTGGEYIIAYERSLKNNPSLFDIAATAVDTWTGKQCEPEKTLSNANADNLYAFVAARYGGKADGDVGNALITWFDSVYATPYDDDCLAYLWESKDGSSVPLGGGCGAGGTAAVCCVRTGNANFTHQLKGAAPSTAVYLMTGTKAASESCGACTYKLDSLAATTVGLVTTDSTGSASVTAPIPADPSLVGTSFIAQWVVVTNAGTCTWVGVDLSNAVKATIQ